MFTGGKCKKPFIKVVEKIMPPCKCKGTPAAKCELFHFAFQIATRCTWERKVQFICDLLWFIRYPSQQYNMRKVLMKGVFAILEKK